MIGYHVLSGKAKLAGVMGWPVSHSLSPALHGYWLQQYGIDGAYVPLPVRPEKTREAIEALRLLGFRGANLTIPHKEHALDVVDILDASAHRAQAVNTLVFHENGQVEGRNTDIFGFAENLKETGFSKSETTNKAVILGAGGAARAVFVALQDMGFSDISFVNRDTGRAEKIAEDLSFQGAFRAVDWDHAPSVLEGGQLLVNTSPLGMKGQLELKIDLAPLAPDAWVSDIVYVPLETELLKQAKEKNFQVCDGIGMLLHQARAGFAAWFGQEPVVTTELRHFVLERL